ncbi:MAG: HD domain-containing protein [Verrucomicrobiota bacterium]
MKAFDFRRAIRDYIRANAKPSDKFSHQPRLYALAVRLAEGAAFDDDVLFAAAWLHDLGVFVGHRPEDPVRLANWDHVAYAFKRVPLLLQQWGFPDGKISAVLEVIRTHMPSGKPGTFEGKLLREADILEQLGAVGILRMSSKAGRDTRFPGFREVVQALRRNLEELPGKLTLDSAKKMAAPRLEVLRQFLEAAELEGASLEP